MFLRVLGNLMVERTGRAAVTVDAIRTHAREARRQQPLAPDSRAAPGNCPRHRGTLREEKKSANESTASGCTRSSSRCAFATAGTASARLSLPRPPAGFASLIVADFPALFAKFGGKRFPLLWRGSGDRFGAADFHGRCDGPARSDVNRGHGGEHFRGHHAGAHAHRNAAQADPGRSEAQTFAFYTEESAQLPDEESDQGPREERNNRLSPQKVATRRAHASRSKHVNQWIIGSINARFPFVISEIISREHSRFRDTTSQNTPSKSEARNDDVNRRAL
jgi:hypothetical protein